MSGWVPGQHPHWQYMIEVRTENNGPNGDLPAYTTASPARSCPTCAGMPISPSMGKRDVNYAAVQKEQAICTLNLPASVTGRDTDLRRKDFTNTREGQVWCWYRIASICFILPGCSSIGHMCDSLDVLFNRKVSSQQNLNELTYPVAQELASQHFRIQTTFTI